MFFSKNKIVYLHIILFIFCFVKKVGNLYYYKTNLIFLFVDSI